MNQTTARRGPNTFLVYGIAAGIIGLWWAGLAALGLQSEEDGRLLLGMVAAPVLLVALLRDPFGMLCFIVFALPFSYGVLQFEVGIVTLSPYSLGMTLAGMLAVAGVAGGKMRLRFAPEDAVVVLLGASFLLSTLTARNVVEAGYLGFHGIFIPVVTYFTVKVLVRTPEDYRKLLVSFVAGVSVFALYGLGQFAVSSERLFILNLPPISAAALMVAGLIVIGYSEWWRKPIGAIAGLVLFAGLLTTFSRGYLVLMILSPLFFIYFRRGQATKMMVAMLVVSLIGTILLVQSYDMFRVQFLDRAQEQSAERVTQLEFWLSSLYGRARYYGVGLEEFAKSPLFGNGFHKGFPSPDGSAVVWHNFHVEWLEYGGIFAYVLYASVFIMHFRGMARAARYQAAFAVNLTVIFTILINGLMNSFTAGISPTLGFLFMGLNRALRSLASGERKA